MQEKKTFGKLLSEQGCQVSGVRLDTEAEVNVMPK